ncbi:MAG: tetratricopeptide repeat protein [Candidatus Scalindua sp.]|nr:tetratricopeptide repeat protein [Candidatus Scalindua sp.]
MEMFNTKLKAFTVFIICLLSLGWIDPAAEHNEEGIILYNENKFDEAASRFTDAQSFVPESDQLKFNIANTHYKKGKFPEAEKSYQDAIKSDDILLKAKGNYNMGNTLYKQGKLKESLDFYKQAIGLSGEHQNIHDEELDALREDAKFNYEFVEKKIEEMQKEQKERQEQEEKDKEKEEQDKEENQEEKGEDQEQEKQEQDQKPQEKKQEQQEQDQNQQEKDENKEEEQKNGQKPSQENETDKPPAPQPHEKREMSKEEAERILDAMKQSEKSARDLPEKEDKSATYGILKDW